MSISSETENQLGYVFRRPELLDEALTHKSHLQGKPSVQSKHNERLEFLGDAVLSLVISDFLASKYPSSTEGELSKVRARLVSRASLAQAARRLGLGDLLRLGRGEEVTHGRVKSSILGNALEAVMGAIYLDGGLDSAKAFILQVLGKEIDLIQSAIFPAYMRDHKSHLQEYCQKQFDMLPTYSLLQESGPDHQKQFEVQVRIQDKILGQGVGKTKKEAEQNAAQQAFSQLIG